MSKYTVNLVVEALEKPSTLAALRRKTGLQMPQLVTAMLEARAAGHPITCVQREPGQVSYFRLEEPNGEDA